MISFQYRQFLKSSSHCENIRNFLSNFVKTAMFNAFIDSKFRVPIFCSTHKEQIDVVSRKKSLTKRRKKTSINESISNERDQNALQITRNNTISHGELTCPREITLHLKGHVQKILQIEVKYTIGHIQEKYDLRKRVFLAKNCIPISSTANIGDVYQIFKDSYSILYITVT